MLHSLNAHIAPCLLDRHTCMDQGAGWVEEGRFITNTYKSLLSAPRQVRYRSMW